MYNHGGYQFGIGYVDTAADPSTWLSRDFNASSYTFPNGATFSLVWTDSVSGYGYYLVDKRCRCKDTSFAYKADVAANTPIYFTPATQHTFIFECL